jgi:hypothetical protein
MNAEESNNFLYEQERIEVKDKLSLEKRASCSMCSF